MNALYDDAGQSKLLGKLVKFRIPSLHGTSVIAGVIKRCVIGGKVEVKAQGGGYFIINTWEILKD